MKTNRWMRFFTILCFILAVFMMGYSIIQNDVSMACLDNENASDFGQNWKLKINDEDKGFIDLPCLTDAESGDILTVTKSIPNILSVSSTICFRTSMAFAKVYIDDELIYSHGYDEKRVFGKAPGSSWNIARLPLGTEGKTLKLQVSSPYEKHSNRLNGVFIGSKASLVFKIIRENIGDFANSFLILMMGIFLLVFTAFIKNKNFSKNVLYLGIFAVVAGIWSFSETKFLQVFFGNATAISDLSMITFLLLPLPFALFLKTVNIYKNNKTLSFVIWVYILNFIVATTLQVLNIFDYFEFLVITHVILLLTLVYFLYQNIKNIIRNIKDEEIIVLNISFLILFLFALADLFSFYISSSINTGVFFRIGILIFIGILAIWSIKKSLSLYQKNIEGNMLKIVAYKDILTKLKNRTAFEEKLDDYRHGTKKIENMAIAIFDLNNLKMINDSYGHYYGDRILIKVALTIKNVFDKIGTCYRIGGDEFSVIFEQIQDDNVLKQYFDEFLIKTKEENIKVAYGYATCDESDHVEDVFKKADSKMYEMKEKMKEEV